MTSVLLSNGYRYNKDMDRYEKIEDNKEMFVKQCNKYVQIVKVINKDNMQLMNTINIKDNDIIKYL